MCVCVCVCVCGVCVRICVCVCAEYVQNEYEFDQLHFDHYTLIRYYCYKLLPAQEFITETYRLVGDVRLVIAR